MATFETEINTDANRFVNTSRSFVNTTPLLTSLLKTSFLLHLRDEGLVIITRLL